jgi:predicted RND superfamily exporter protein
MTGISDFKITSYQEQGDMLEKGEAARKANERFINYFGGQKSMILTYKPKDGNIFSKQSLKTLKAVQEELIREGLGLQGNQDSPLKHITQVRSLINAPYLNVENNNLYSKEFVGDKLPQSEADSELLKTLALKHPEYGQSFLSLDGKYGALIIKTNFQVVESNAEKSLAVPGEESLDILENIKEGETAPIVENKKAPEIKLTHHSLSDYAMFEKRVEEIISSDNYAKTLAFSPTSWGTIWEKYIFQPQLNIAITCMNILIVMLIFILFRSFSAIAWSFLVVSIPIGAMMGLAGWLELDIKNSIYIAISLTMVSAICDVIHIFFGYNLFRQEGHSHIDALTKVFKESSLGCLLTSSTTVLGMLSLPMVPIVEVRNIGLLAAFGIFVGSAIIFFVLPLMMDLWSPYSEKKNVIKRTDFSFLIQRLIRNIELIGINRPKSVFFLFIIATFFFVYQATKIQVDTLSINAWSKDEPARQASELINDYFGGISGINVLLETGVENGLKNPEILFAMDMIAQKLKEQYPEWVTKSYSIVNEVKYAFQNLNEGRTDMFKIPQDHSTLEETLFLFNNANPEDRSLLVTDDYSSASIYIRMKDPGSRLGEKIVNCARKDVEAILSDLKEAYPDIKITLTGDLVHKSAIKNYVSWSQLESFGLAFLVISILFVVIFGSLKVGFLSLIPNLVPIILCFGIMGWRGISLDETTLMVAPILIGIVVDDTIHFICHYRYYMHAERDMTLAIQSTFRVAGQANLTSNFILFFNFLLLNFVSHLSVARFGWLSAVAIVIAFLADCFLLPALLVYFNADFNVKEIAVIKKNDRMKFITERKQLS